MHQSKYVNTVAEEETGGGQMEEDIPECNRHRDQKYVFFDSERKSIFYCSPGDVRKKPYTAVQAKRDRRETEIEIEREMWV